MKTTNTSLEDLAHMPMKMKCCIIALLPVLVSTSGFADELDEAVKKAEKINAATQSADDSTHSEAAADTNAPQEEQVASDRDAIQGEWQVVAMRAAGNPGPDSIIAVTRYAFDGETLTIKLGESRSDDYTFTLDPSAKPMAACDMTPIGSQAPAETMKGIYVLEGDSLKICLGKHQRPVEMSAEEEDGFGQVLVELERAKP